MATDPTGNDEKTDQEKIGIIKPSTLLLVTRAKSEGQRWPTEGGGTPKIGS